jgi:hypothetical protein
VIARTRRRLLRAARALKKDGAVPPGVDNPEVYTNVRSGDFLADAKISWRDAYDMQIAHRHSPLSASRGMSAIRALVPDRGAIG